MANKGGGGVEIKGGNHTKIRPQILEPALPQQTEKNPIRKLDPRGHNIIGLKGQKYPDLFLLVLGCPECVLSNFTDEGPPNDHYQVDKALHYKPMF